VACPATSRIVSSKLLHGRLSVESQGKLRPHRRMPVGSFHIHTSDSRRIAMLNECWSTHTQRGYKMKGGKQVPNCVPKGMKEEIHMSNITNKFTNKVMEAIVMRNRGGYMPGPGNVSSMTVGGKGKSVGGQRPEPYATTTSPDSPMHRGVPVNIGDKGRSTKSARSELARRVRSTRPGNRAAGEEGLRSNITRETP